MSNTPQQQETVLLNENGVTITTRYISGNGHKLEFSKIQSVRIDDLNEGLWPALLFWRKPSHRIVVRPSEGEDLVTIVETGDADFLKRVKQAMDRAAAATPQAGRTC